MLLGNTSSTVYQLLLKTLITVYTEVSRYYDTARIRQKYHIIQTIGISRINF